MNHPIFSKVYIWGQDKLEQLVGEDRRRQNQRAYGRTLIIGAGTGLDIPQLSDQVTETVLLEPDPAMQTYLHAQYPTFSILGSTAEDIPCDDESFDTVLSSLVLCSVQATDQVLRELYRILKPGGQYLFMEHVAHHAGVGKAIQNGMNPIWKRMAGGCNVNRPIQMSLHQSQLNVVECEMVKNHLIIPIIAGRAIRPEASC